jgi:hypothetical protein
VSQSAEDKYVRFLSSRLPRPHRAAYLLCGDRHRAEDIVQATALNLFLKWKHVSAADNMDGYLHRMLVREFLGQRRVQRIASAGALTLAVLVAVPGVIALAGRDRTDSSPDAATASASASGNPNACAYHALTLPAGSIKRWQLSTGQVTTVTVPGAPFAAEAARVRSDGSVVAIGRETANDGSLVVVTGDRRKVLSVPAGATATARDVNIDGTIVYGTVRLAGTRPLRPRVAISHRPRTGPADRGRAPPADRGGRRRHYPGWRWTPGPDCPWSA